MTSVTINELGQKNQPKTTLTALEWAQLLLKTIETAPYSQKKALECIKKWGEQCRSEGIDVNAFKMDKISLRDEEGNVGTRLENLLAQKALLLWIKLKGFSDDASPCTLKDHGASEEQISKLLKAIWREGVLVDTHDLSETRDFKGQRIVYVACYYGLDTVLEEAITAGSNLHHMVKESLYTPLMIASRMGHLKIVQHLVQEGVQLDTQNKIGHTALMHAAADGHLKIVEFLITQGADIRKESKTGDALHFAVFNPSQEILSYLWEHLKRISDPSELETYEVCHVAAAGHLEALKCLIEAGANFRLINKDGETPLEVAKKNNHDEEKRYLEEVLNAVKDRSELESVLPAVKGTRQPKEGRGPSKKRI